MNKITQHIPNFFEYDDADIERGSFEGIVELFQVPFVARWAQTPGFHKFSQNDKLLLIELRGGREWWVVGRLQDPVEGLPQWDHGLYEVWDSEGNPLEVPGTEVSYSCGYDVGLRDGRVLKKRKSTHA